MNTFEKQLLKLAYENFRKNGSSYTEFQPQNGEDAMYYSDAIEYLEESEHVVSHINNLMNGSVSLSNSDSVICYELTEKGLTFVRSTVAL